MNTIISFLERTPIMESACMKLDIARSTVYRWMNSDADFKSRVEHALENGRDTVNDVAESRLIEKVKNGDMGAVKYWLTNNNGRFKKSQQNSVSHELPQIPQEVVGEFVRFLYSKHDEPEKPDVQ